MQMNGIVPYIETKESKPDGIAVQTDILAMQTILPVRQRLISGNDGGRLIDMAKIFNKLEQIIHFLLHIAHHSLDDGNGFPLRQHNA